MRDPLVLLMWLLRMCLRWLMPVAAPMHPAPATSVPAQPPDVPKMSGRRQIGLAPILAPPPLLRPAG
ncbi:MULTISPECIES: hypothetical protein [Pseudacidovorax]|nr:MULTISPECIES: hypothetical protein [Pseudacidovorax]